MVVEAQDPVRRAAAARTRRDARRLRPGRYDGVGNRLSFAGGPDGTVVSSHDAADELVSSTADAGLTGTEPFPDD